MSKQQNEGPESIPSATALSLVMRITVHRFLGYTPAVPRHDPVVEQLLGQGTLLARKLLG